MPETGSRQRRPLEETRRLLLTVGHQLLADRGYPQHIDLKLAEVVGAANMTTGAAYKIWDSQREFQEDLAHYVVSETSDWAGVATIADELAEVLGAEPTFEELVRQAGNIYMREFLGREEFFTLLYFHTVRDRDKKLTTSISQGYDRIHQEFRELFDGLLTLYGRGVREPYSLDDLCLAASTLAEGMALRHRIQPRLVNRTIERGDGEWHPFSSALLTLGLEYTVQLDSGKAG